MKMRFCAVLVAVAASAVIASPPPTPPAQPDRGFGGRDYRHGGYVMSSHGEAAAQFWIFEPDEPKPQAAPVVVFLHGWGAMNPGTYGRWIEHLARRGHIVIYPRYQVGWLTPGETVTDAAMVAVKAALALLDEPGHVKPQVAQLAVVGHSMGGVLAANFAALAKEKDLPVPRAVTVLQPGIIRADDGGRVGMPLADLSKIASETLMLVIVGDQDQVTGRADGWTIFRGATAVPTANKNLLLMQSDFHGEPPLVADHRSPLSFDTEMFNRAREDMAAAAPGKTAPEGDGKQQEFGQAMLIWLAQDTVNALDHRGYWRLFDALTAAAFDDGDKAAALGDTAAQRDMGQWSDQTPVKSPKVTITP